MSTLKRPAPSTEEQKLKVPKKGQLESAVSAEADSSLGKPSDENYFQQLPKLFPKLSTHEPESAMPKSARAPMTLDLSTEDSLDTILQRYFESEKVPKDEQTELKNSLDALEIHTARKLLMETPELFVGRPPTWGNWDKNQTCNDALYVKPTSLQNLCIAIKTQFANVDKIVCSGYRHSWSPIVCSSVDSGNKTLIIDSALMFNVLSTPEQVNKYQQVTVESGVSLKKMQQWFDDNNVAFTPSNSVVLTEVFVTGVTVPMCHGAGYNHGCLSEEIVALTMVKVDGTLVTYHTDEFKTPENATYLGKLVKLDEDKMNFIRGSLGTCGFVYAITIKLVKNSSVQMTDQRLDLQILQDPDQLKKLLKDLDGRAEIFWCPFQTKIWLKSWKESTVPATEPTLAEKAEDWFGTKVSKWIFQNNPKTLKAAKSWNKFIFWAMTQSFTLNERVRVWSLYNTLHYRAGIDDYPVEDCEMAIPFTENDVSPVVAAFDIIKTKIEEYGNRNLFPVNLVVEMRFTNPSPVALAPGNQKLAQNGAGAKFVHIEFLRGSVVNKPDQRDLWRSFIKDVTSAWIQQLKAFPHWAKDWEPIEGHEKLMYEHPNTLDFLNFRSTLEVFGDNDQAKKVNMKKFMNHKLSEIFKQ